MSRKSVCALACYRMIDAAVLAIMLERGCQSDVALVVGSRCVAGGCFPTPA